MLGISPALARTGWRATHRGAIRIERKALPAGFAMTVNVMRSNPTSATARMFARRSASPTGQDAGVYNPTAIVRAIVVSIHMSAIAFQYYRGVEFRSKSVSAGVRVALPFLPEEVVADELH